MLFMRVCMYRMTNGRFEVRIFFYLTQVKIYNWLGYRASTAGRMSVLALYWHNSSMPVPKDCTGAVLALVQNVTRLGVVF